MGVSKNRGTPKWMVFNGKPYLNGWFGGKTHYFRKHPYLQDDPRYFWRTLLMWKNLPKNEADWMPSEDDAAQAPVGGVAWMVKRGLGNWEEKKPQGLQLGCPSPNKWINTVTCLWQLKYFPKIGEMIQFDKHIFQMGWIETTNQRGYEARLQICPLYIFRNYPPQMVPKYLSVLVFQGFGVLAAWFRVKSTFPAAMGYYPPANDHISPA